VLDEIQVRGGDAEPLREVNLAQAVSAAQRADLGTEFRARHAEPLPNFTSSTDLQHVVF
jgi:hypothetical protein